MRTEPTVFVVDDDEPVRKAKAVLNGQQQAHETPPLDRMPLISMPYAADPSIFTLSRKPYHPIGGLTHAAVRADKQTSWRFLLFPMLACPRRYGTENLRPDMPRVASSLLRQSCRGHLPSILQAGPLKGHVFGCVIRIRQICPAPLGDSLPRRGLRHSCRPPRNAARTRLTD